MSAPQFSKLSLRLHSLASLPISPEPDRNQICARAAGSAASVAIPAKSLAPRQTVQSPGRRIANTSARSGNFPRPRSTSKLCRSAARTTPRVQEWMSRPLGALQQAQQIRRQRRKLRSRHRTLRVNDDVPSCGYLQPVTAYNFAQTPPDTIAHYPAAQAFLMVKANRLCGSSLARKKTVKWELERRFPAR